MNDVDVNQERGWSRVMDKWESAYRTIEGREPTLKEKMQQLDRLREVAYEIAAVKINAEDAMDAADKYNLPHNQFCAALRHYLYYVEIE